MDIYVNRCYYIKLGETNCGTLLKKGQEIEVQGLETKEADEKDKLINRQKVWDMANDLDKNAFVHSIYEEEHKKALQKFSGVTDKKANIDGFEEFE